MKNDYLDQAFGLGTRGAGDGRGAGLGYAIAQALGRAGAKVVVNDLSAQACDAACERANAAGIPARGAVRRGRRRGCRRGALRELEAAGWAPDVLVSNAGNQNRKPVVEMTPAEWQALQNDASTAPSTAPARRCRAWSGAASAASC